MKTQILVRLEPDVAKHLDNNILIKNKTKTFNELYRAKYMDRDKIEQELQECNEHITYLSSQLKLISQADNSIMENFSEEEKKFIKFGIQERLEKGADIKNIARWFNNMYNKNYTGSQLIKLKNIVSI